MIRQICPHCQKPVEFSDEAAGSTQPCPDCGEEFAVPGRYTPAVDPSLAAPPKPESPPAPPPPGFVPPGSRPTPVQVAGEFAPPARVEGRGLTIRPAVLDWFPAGCFTAILLLTLFPWVGLYPGGYEAYSQGPWRATVGRFATDSFAESVMKVQTKLAELTHSNWVMGLYLVGLLLAVVLSWADRIVAAERSATLPPRLGILQSLWPHRFPILAGLALGLLALLLIQVYAGFGLESATEKMVAASFADKPVASDNAAAVQTREIERGMALGEYQVRTTFWLGLVIGTHVVAVIAAALRLWLYRRGSKPLPRLVWEA